MSIANPHLQDKDEDRRHAQLKRWAAVSSLSVAVVLITVKALAFLVTDSVSLLSSLMDSSFDAFASLVTILSIVHAATPADEDHRFGHGKMEALSALGQAVFVLGSAVFLFFEALHRFVRPQHIKQAETGIAVMICSIVLTAALIVFQQYVIRKTKSVAIAADYLHYKGDLLMNLGVFAALCLSYYSRWPYFDPIFACVIALSLLWGARSVSREAFDILMDKELPQEERDNILRLARSHKAVKAVHDLRTRSSGERVFIEFHLELDGAMTLATAHAVTEEIEKILYDAIPKSEVLIHQEPAGIDDYRIDDNIAPVKS